MTIFTPPITLTKPLFKPKPQFGNNSDYASETSIDFSAPKKEKKERKPLTATKKYKSFYHSANTVRAKMDFLPFLAGMATFLGGFTGLMVYEEATDNYYHSSDSALGQYHDYHLPDIEQDIYKDVDTYSQLETSETADKVVRERVMSEVYHYLDNLDGAIHASGEAPWTIELDSLLGPDSSLTPEQQNNLENSLLTLAEAKDLGDLRALTNELIEDYLTPVILETPSVEDDLDLALYQNAADNFFNDLENEKLFYQIPLTVAAGAASVMVVSMLTIATTRRLPRPTTA